MTYRTALQLWSTKLRGSNATLQGRPTLQRTEWPKVKVSFSLVRLLSTKQTDMVVLGFTASFQAEVKPSNKRKSQLFHGTDPHAEILQAYL